jgi:uncharacterized protein DUF4833
VLRGLSLCAALVAVAAGALVVGVARGDAGHDVGSVFFVAKSENRNQVHYGIHLDEACAPVGTAPVFAYWRMLEQGPLATEPLLRREVDAYGFAGQGVAERGAEGGRVKLALRALPGRPITVQSAAREGKCEATATTTIGGAPASLRRVFVQLRWPFGVDHLEIAGRALADGRWVEERTAP